MTAKIYDSLPKEAEAIRRAVFMDEQGFKDEFDDIDGTAWHIVIFDGSVPAATCRVFFDEKLGKQEDTEDVITDRKDGDNEQDKGAE